MIEREGLSFTHRVKDFLAGGALHVAWAGMDEVDAVAQEFQRVLEALRRLRFHEELKLRCKFIHRIEAQCHRHAALGAEGVDRDGEFGNPAVDCRLLEEKRLASSGRLHLPVGYLGDLEFRGHWLPDAAQLAGVFKGFQESGVGWIGHGVMEKRMPSGTGKVTKKIAPAAIA